MWYINGENKKKKFTSRDNFNGLISFNHYPHIRIKCLSYRTHHNFYGDVLSLSSVCYDNQNVDEAKYSHEQNKVNGGGEELDISPRAIQSTRTHYWNTHEHVLKI